MVEYPVDDHPLRFDAVAVEALLHHSILGVFALPLLAVELLLPGAVVIRRWLVHVVLTLVVPIHDGVIQLQLRHKQGEAKQSILLGFIHLWLRAFLIKWQQSIRAIDSNLIRYFSSQNGFSEGY